MKDKQMPKKTNNTQSNQNFSMTTSPISFLSSILLLLSAFTLFIPLHLSAEYKIATIDINKILNETSESKSAKITLDAQAKAAKQAIEEKRNALKATGEALKASKAKPDSPEAQQLKKDAQEFSQMVKESETALRKKHAELNANITEKTLSIVKQYAKENNIDIVLEKGATGRSAVLYGKAQVDITKSVQEKMLAGK